MPQKSSYFIPSLDVIEANRRKTPKEMVPVINPSAVVYDSIVTPEHCLEIVEYGRRIAEYKFTGCGAKTTEIPGGDKILDTLRHLALDTNETVFKFDLHATTLAWMQTYYEGSQYEMHIDGHPGQSRKLTAILLLTDEACYEGGDLIVTLYPLSYQIPRRIGTVVVLPSWVLHHVTQVTNGVRRSINLGFYGPQFR